jgi:Arm DNA-binding domain/Phage integrase family/Phage integrase, N-terminal SAM-like domain
MAGKLNELKIRQLVKAGNDGKFGDGDGLYLQISKGSASWLFRYKDNGRSRWQGLGPLDDVGLAAARDKAREQRQLRLKGIDPIEHRKEARLKAKIADGAPKTVKECCEQYFAAHQTKWRKRSRLGYQTAMRQHIFPKIGDWPIDKVDTTAVIELLKPIWWRIPAAAGVARWYLEHVLDWATVSKYRTCGEENPARWKGNLKHVFPSRAEVREPVHRRAMPYDELPEFIARLRKLSGVLARCLEFMILTNTRPNEALGARWDEINLDERVWIIPASRMKKDKEHRIPLSARALEILGQMEVLPDPSLFREECARVAALIRQWPISSNVVQRDCEIAEAALVSESKVKWTRKKWKDQGSLRVNSSSRRLSAGLANSAGGAWAPSRRACSTR